MKEIKKIKNLIKNFERRHKKVYLNEEYFVDCQIVENSLTRVAPKNEWLGDAENWKEAKKEEAERDKSVKCFTCEFIKDLKRELKNG